MFNFLEASTSIDQGQEMGGDRIKVIEKQGLKNTLNSIVTISRSHRVEIFVICTKPVVNFFTSYHFWKEFLKSHILILIQLTQKIS